MKNLSKAAIFALFPAIGAVLGFSLAGDEGAGAELPKLFAIAGGTYAVALAAVFTLLATGVIKQADAAAKPAPPGELTTTLTSLVSFVVMAAIGWAVAARWATPIPDILAVDTLAVVIGLAAAIPPAIMLHFIMTLDVGPVRAFREKQIALFVERNLDVGWITILLISLGAGIGEEILFRGALQPLFQEWTTPLLGLLIASALFGLAHAANWTYIVITGAVGLYLGTLFMVTGNLLIPIIGHAAYDIYALAVTVKAVRAHKALGATG